MTVTTATASPADAPHSAPHFVLASYTTPTGVASISSPGTDKTLNAAHQALADADAAVAAAATVTSDIQASGLDIGTPKTTVDTTALRTAAARLKAADLLPTPLLPDLTSAVTTLRASVAGTVQGLRSSLDAAKALKAQQEAAAAAAAAAAEAQRQAAAAAAAAAAQASSSSAPSSSSPTSSSPSYASAGTSAGEAQSIAHGMLGGYGWGEDQFGCLVSLWNRESGWNVHAGNASGAYGIPQALPGSKMASAGADWADNAATQIAWGFGYISGRYGNPCGAWAHSESTGWY